MRYLTAMTVIAFSCASQASAAPSTRAFSITGFDRIAVAGPFEVVVHTGPGVSVRATGETAALDRIDVTVDNGLLRIRPTTDLTNGWLGSSMGRTRIAVTVPGLRAASLYGSGNLSIDRAKADNFVALLDGSGNIGIGALQADSLTAAVGGSGNLKIAGKAATVRARLVGSGDLDAAGLSVADATITASGSGNARLAASHSANVSSSGSGDVVVTGAARCTVAQHGSGDVSCGRGG